MPTDEYINLIGNDANWAADLEIIITAFIFSINIAIYKYTETEEFLEYIHFYGYEEETNNNPIFLLLNQNENHYLLGYPKNDTKNNNDNNLTSNDIFGNKYELKECYLTKKKEINNNTFLTF